jgi:hypothetical protein
MRSSSWWVALPAVLASLFALPREASACGGCFHGETTTVVTDHRMVLSIAKDQSTLYDQITYSGSPAAFAWVLPISGTVQVGLSSDAVFQVLDAATATSVISPALACPAAAAICPQEGGAKKSLGGPEESVTVTQRDVVGPYETVQLKATDPNALETWLAQNGFLLPADLRPVIAQYVAEKFDFLALKLLPGHGVKDMRPVRVTTQGANAVLPLRMVAAGTGATVGITLWVVGEGRYEPQNFPVFVVGDAELVWDWTQNKSNYVDVRAQKTAAGGGRAWELESSTTRDVPQLQSSIASALPSSYLPVMDAQGGVAKTADQVRDEDLAALLHGVTSARVTRFRSDLAHAALSTDLVMVASQDQGEIRTQRYVTRELSEPLCPVYDGCAIIGNAPRSQAAAQSKTDAASPSSSSSSSCVMGSSGASPVAPALAAGVAAVAFSLARARRRRRAQVLEKR